MPNARAVALRALLALDRGRTQRLRSELAAGAAAARLEPREAAFAFELAHGAVRRERLLDFVIAGLAHRGLPKDPRLRCALRLGVYQLLFVAGMPAHAAVHETVAVVRGNKGFANALLRRVALVIESRAADPAAATAELELGPGRTLLLPQPLPDDEVARLAIVHSLPDWFAARCCERHGIDGLRRIAAAASAAPGVYLRPVHGVERASLRAELADAGVDTEPSSHPRLAVWTGGGTPFATKAFAEGRFVVQDPTALAAAEAVPCGPGDTVVDLCAAPGTKTVWLAERVRPGGRVFAHDPDAARRERIVDNVARLRLGDVVTVVASAPELPVGDCVLADVPCSNTGVLGRRVEVRRRLTPAAITERAALQRELLARAIALCRPGGTVVYSTCSIEREENDDVVDAVLGAPATPRCEVGERRLTLPLAGAHDGGYFAVLRRA